MFSIGEFSRITGITVKALRFYHEQGLLVPTTVDPRSGYRFYDASMIDRAQAVVYLRALEFPVDQIRELLRDSTDDSQILSAMETHKSAIEQRIGALHHVVASLEDFIQQQREAKAMLQSTETIEEKDLAPLLIAAVRMKGRYADCSRGFSKIGRAMGRHIAGPAMMLHYDDEYKEDDADFEAAMPLRRNVPAVDGISVRELPAARCVTLTHVGPYDQMGPSYAKVLQYTKDKGYAIHPPTREVYLKGPGMIFKGNPAKYVTEIQIPVQPLTNAQQYD